MVDGHFVRIWFVVWGEVLQEGHVGECEGSSLCLNECRAGWRPDLSCDKDTLSRGVNEDS